MKKQIILFGFLFFLLIVLFGFLYLLVKNIPKNQPADDGLSNIKINNCFLEKEYIVRGDSLSGFMDSGEEVTALEGFYDCNPAERNDLVLYQYAGNKNYLIKSVKAVPEDKWHLKDMGSYYLIFVNNKILKNDSEEEYRIPRNEAKMLLIYSKNYPQIPQNTYLLMGNVVSGSLDSTKFGLVDKSDIVAKVTR